MLTGLKITFGGLTDVYKNAHQSIPNNLSFSLGDKVPKGNIHHPKSPRSDDGNA